MKKRLYTFGCSLTKYFYPTWADFIGQYYDVYENWGKSGAGNFFIASQIHECNQLNKLTEFDTVLVMFSNYIRYDFISENSDFITCGNVYSTDFYDTSFKKYWSEEHGLYNSWFSILSAYNLLKNIGCNYKLMWGFDLRLLNNYATGNEIVKYYPSDKKRMHHCYYGVKDLLPDYNFFDFYNKDKCYFFDGIKDYHPSISEHLRFIKMHLNEFFQEEMNKISMDWEKLISLKQRETIDNFASIINSKNKGFIDTPLENKKKIL